MHPLARVIRAIALLAAFAVVTPCSSGGADSPIVGIDIVELNRLVEGRLNEAVSKGIVSPADQQQFLGNLGAGDSGAILVGYVKGSTASSILVAAYPNGTEVDLRVDRATQVLRGNSGVRLADLEKGELILVVRPTTRDATLVRGYGVKAP
jgi:hypothetical protein